MTNVTSFYANGLTTWSDSGLLLKYVAFVLQYPYLSHLSTLSTENGVASLDSSPDLHHALEVTSDSSSYFLPGPCGHYIFTCNWCKVYYILSFVFMGFGRSSPVMFRPLFVTYCYSKPSKSAYTPVILSRRQCTRIIPSFPCIIISASVAYIHSRVFVTVAFTYVFRRSITHFPFVRITISSPRRARIK